MDAGTNPAHTLPGRWFPLSRLSWTLILLFLSLHTVGAHYTDAEVPYDAWSELLVGVRVNDRLTELAPVALPD